MSKTVTALLLLATVQSKALACTMSQTAFTIKAMTAALADVGLQASLNAQVEGADVGTGEIVVRLKESPTALRECLRYNARVEGKRCEVVAKLRVREKCAS